MQGSGVEALASLVPLTQQLLRYLFRHLLPTTLASALHCAADIPMSWYACQLAGAFDGHRGARGLTDLSVSTSETALQLGTLEQH